MSAKKKTVFVIYYSMYGHIQKMAREVCKGLEKSGGSYAKKVEINNDLINSLFLS